MSEEHIRKTEQQRPSVGHRSTMHAAPLICLGSAVAGDRLLSAPREFSTERPLTVIMARSSTLEVWSS